MNKHLLPLMFILTVFLLTIHQQKGYTHSGDSFNYWYEQTVYVPLYSHIYADERFRNKPFLLTATLSIRNTDPDNSMMIERVDYYDSSGNLLQKYLSTPLKIGPLESTRYIDEESESKGGSGAKFLVSWTAEKAITTPVIESIMIGTKMQQGISFISRGIIIRGKTKN